MPAVLRSLLHRIAAIALPALLLAAAFTAAAGSSTANDPAAKQKQLDALKARLAHV